MNIEARTASVLGRDHRLREANRQDATQIANGCTPTGARYAVGSVADGCGSALRSETGAALLAAVATYEASRRLASGACAEAAVEGAFQRANRALRAVCGVVAPREKRLDFVEEHLLATLLVVAHDGDEIAIGARGDGVIVWDDEVLVLDRNGAPDYLAYDLTGPAVAPLIEVRKACGIDRVAIASDGLLPELATRVFGHRGRGLQRWLNVQATRAPLLDDASVVVIERKEGV